MSFDSWCLSRYLFHLSCWIYCYKVFHNISWSSLFRFRFLSFFIFWQRWVFSAAFEFSVVAVSRGHSSCGAWASPCSGFSCCGPWTLGRCMDFSRCRTWAQLLQLTGSRARLSRCGSRARCQGMWNLPGPEIKFGSPALAGTCLTTFVIFLMSLGSIVYLFFYSWCC